MSGAAGSVSYKVFVASGNKDKINAAVRAIELFDENTEQSLIYSQGISVDSGIPEQPFGKEETQLGASNRLRALALELKEIDNAVGPNVFLFSFENGIIQDSDGKYYDLPCVLILHPKTKVEIISWGEKVPVAASFVEASKATNQEVTVGEFIHKEFGYPAGSWHGSLYHKERWEILTEAALAGLHQFSK